MLVNKADARIHCYHEFAYIKIVEIDKGIFLFYFFEV